MLRSSGKWNLSIPIETQRAHLDRAKDAKDAKDAKHAKSAKSAKIVMTTTYLGTLPYLLTFTLPLHNRHTITVTLCNHSIPSGFNKFFFFFLFLTFSFHLIIISQLPADTGPLELVAACFPHFFLQNSIFSSQVGA